MAVIASTTTQRRKSVSVVKLTTSDSSAEHPRDRKKRSQSLVPSELPSLAKSRRRMMPRKSILKQTSYQDDGSSCDYTTDLRDNTTRRSMVARRVSFAEHAHVRIFETHHTNGTASPNSSPAAPSGTGPVTSSSHSKENGPASAAYSIRSTHNLPPDGLDDASEDMSFDEESAPRETAPSDEDGDDEDNDMDMTDAIAAHIRKSSLSRRRSSIRRRSSYGAGSEDMELDDGEDGGEPMEFTVPLTQTLKKPGPPDPAWLALRAMTHSGDTELEPELPSEDEQELQYQGANENMGLDDAMARLRAVQLSHGIGVADGGDDHVAEAEEASYSTTTTEDSMDINTEVDVGDRTLNLTGLLGRPSIRSDMENTGVYGGALVADTWPSSPARQEEATPSSLTQPPDVTRPSPVPTVSVQIVSPNSNAPALLQDSVRRESLARRDSLATPHGTVFSNAPASPFRPQKRAATSDPDSAIASPAKRRASTGRRSPASKDISPAEAAHTTVQREYNTVLSPSRKANAEANASRRPSGYFSKRKSLLETEVEAESSQSPTTRTPVSLTKVNLPALEDRPGSTAVVERQRSPVLRIHNRDEQLNDLTEHWRSGVDEGINDVDEGPPISIEQFFAMTEIKFMDDLTCPRRSTIYPSQLDRRQSAGKNAEDFSLAEYLIAMAVDVPQLELSSWVNNDLTAWIEQSKKNFIEYEDLVAQMTPGLFREYTLANDVGRADLQHHLKLIKANNHGVARAKWYDYKYEWVRNLSGDASKGFEQLERDAQQIETDIKQVQEVLPALREEYEQIMRELDQEQKEVAELEGGDQDYLHELKATIAEQNGELETFRAEVAEGRSKVQRLQDKLQELTAEKWDAQNGIADAHRLLNKRRHSTRTEIFRLKDELEGLQALHLWGATKVGPSYLQFDYRSRYQLEIPCLNFKPIMRRVRFTTQESVPPLCKKVDEERFPELNTVFVDATRDLLSRLEDGCSVRQIIQLLSDSWTSFGLLRKQLTFLAIKFPLAIHTPINKCDLHVVSTILLDQGRTKAKVSFSFDAATIAMWPATLSSMHSNVDIAYGKIDGQVVLNAIRKRLQKSDILDNHGCILDACIEATEECGR